MSELVEVRIDPELKLKAEDIAKKKQDLKRAYSRCTR